MRRPYFHRTPVSQWQRLAAEGIVSAGARTYSLESIRIHEFRSPDGQWIGARLRIGAYCSIAPCDVFLAGNHRMDWVSQYPFRSKSGAPGADEENTTRGDVMIGSDVWIGDGATIMSGVTIGHGAVVAARAVVARDVAPYSIVVGNPAQMVRRRFDDETIARLLASKWWDWPDERIRANHAWLGSPPTPVPDGDLR